MKKRVLIVAAIATIAVFVIKFVLPGKQTNGISPLKDAKSVHPLSGGKTQANSFVPPPDTNQRSQMSDAELSSMLEQLGALPEGASLREKLLAQKTSWWGKRINAEQFWQGKVIWLDEAAIAACQRQGRQWPPIPFKDPKIESLALDDSDVRPRFADIGGNNVHYVYSYKEDAFWQMFSKKSPKPPERIRQKQLDLARAILVPQTQTSAGDAYAKKVAEVQENGRRSAKARETKVGYPPEALSDEALFATWASALRNDYERLRAEGHENDSVAVKSLLFGWPFDVKLIIDPASQTIDDTSWKAAYLQRLRREKVDESYIQAYLRAWNLSEQEVFSSQGK